MPTLKDIQEKKGEIMLLANTIFTAKASDSFQVLEMFIDKLTTLAHQACLDMVLKEIEGKITSFHEIDCYFLQDGSYLKTDCTCGLFYKNGALSSLKEKIISDNQK